MTYSPKLYSITSTSLEVGHYVQPTLKGSELGFGSWRKEYQQILVFFWTTTLLQNHNTTIHIRKLTEICNYRLILRSHTSFSTWPNNVLLQQQDPSENHTLHLVVTSPKSPPIWNSCSFFDFHDLDILKISGYFTAYSSVWICWSFLVITFRLCISERKSQMCYYVFSLQSVRWSVISICPIIGGVYFDHLAKVVSASLIAGKLLIVPL